MTNDTEDLIKTRLLSENDEFKLLFDKHEALNRKVAELSQKKYLLPAEEIELNNLKKQKLAGKDKMHQILTESQ